MHIFWVGEGAGAEIYKTLIYKTGRLISQTLVRACNVLTKNTLLNIVFTEMTSFNIQCGVKRPLTIQRIYGQKHTLEYTFLTLLIMYKR